MVEPSPSQLATLKLDFSATVELTRPERGTLEESAGRAPGARKDAPARRCISDPEVSAGPPPPLPPLAARPAAPNTARAAHGRAGGGSAARLSMSPRLASQDSRSKGSTLSPCTVPGPGTWKGGNVLIVTLPQILTQVHKAHDHVRVVEEGAVLSAGQWGRSAAARSRGKEALAVEGVRSSGGRLPKLGRAGPSTGPGLPPLLVQRRVHVVVVGQGVVQIQHEEGCGL